MEGGCTSYPFSSPPPPLRLCCRIRIPKRAEPLMWTLSPCKRFVPQAISPLCVLKCFRACFHIPGFYRDPLFTPPLSKLLRDISSTTKRYRYRASTLRSLRTQSAAALFFSKRRSVDGQRRVLSFGPFPTNVWPFPHQ